jgi:hypothetical protein
MASVLQVLIAVAPLKGYLIANIKNIQAVINTENFLGSKGEVSKAFTEFMYNYQLAAQGKEFGLNGCRLTTTSNNRQVSLKTFKGRFSQYRITYIRYSLRGRYAQITEDFTTRNNVLKIF